MDIRKLVFDKNDNYIFKDENVDNDIQELRDTIITELPISNGNLGCVKIGNNINIDDDGKISVDVDEKSSIKNIKTGFVNLVSSRGTIPATTSITLKNGGYVLAFAMSETTTNASGSGDSYTMNFSCDTSGEILFEDSFSVDSDTTGEHQEIRLIELSSNQSINLSASLPNGNSAYCAIVAGFIVFDNTAIINNMSVVDHSLKYTRNNVYTYNYNPEHDGYILHVAWEAAVSDNNITEMTIDNINIKGTNMADQKNVSPNSLSGRNQYCSQALYKTYSGASYTYRRYCTSSNYTHHTGFILYFN